MLEVTVARCAVGCTALLWNVCGLCCTVLSCVVGLLVVLLVLLCVTMGCHGVLFVLGRSVLASFPRNLLFSFHSSSVSFTHVC